MDRREFVAAGVGAGLGTPAVLGTRRDVPGRPQDDVRAWFPRLGHGTFLNTAAGAPLGAFAEAGLQRYTDLLRLGPGEGREDYFQEMLSNIRARYGEIIGAAPEEIALVHCTKEGERIVTDALLVPGRNIVTNDLHFSGSLHNLVGLQRAGHDVRIVRAHNWDVSLDAMAAAIDEGTALVAVTYVSNINGRVEPVRELADYAHARGAFVYADIIQATGAMPLDMRALGIDFAASNGYKWLFGVHGAGFLYVRQELQGTALPDRLFPGHVGFNYTPWTDTPDPSRDELTFTAPRDAERYQPGHVSYLSYCAVYEGLRVVGRLGPKTILAQAVRHNRRLLDGVDPARYELISPHPDRSPIVTFLVSDPQRLRARLDAAALFVTLSGRRLRVSPAFFNTDADIDRLLGVMNDA